MKLQRLSAKESSGEEVLDGTYRVVLNIQVTADKNLTLQDLEKKVAEAGILDDMHIEKYPSKAAAFNTGDTVELISEINCVKSVYLDTGGNLVISDRPVAAHVEKVGDFSIRLPKGTVAEVNKYAEADRAEILFAGEAIELNELNRVAYLGILELPSNLFVRAGL